ncbi:MAG: multiprotein bridging factor aMBF1 [Candidatus Bathyarchaeia archaeon]
MNCEICGKEILGKPYNKVVEGVKMVLCEKCASYGEAYFQPVTLTKLSTPVKVVTKPKTSKSIINKEYLELEVVPDYFMKIKSTREKIGLTQEEFAKKLNEKLSVIQKIEVGKIIPDINLAKKIESLLKIKLLTPTQEEKIISKTVEKPTLTLGNLAKIKYKSKIEKGI